MPVQVFSLDRNKLYKLYFIYHFAIYKSIICLEYEQAISVNGICACGAGPYGELWLKLDLSGSGVMNTRGTYIIVLRFFLSQELP